MNLFSQTNIRQTSKMMPETPVVNFSQISFGHCGLVKAAVLWVSSRFFLSFNGERNVLQVFGMKLLRGVLFYKK